MKLLRFGDKGQEKPGLLAEDGIIRDLSGVSEDFAGETVSLTALEKLRGLDVTSLPVVEGSPRLGSCVATVPNFFCIGLNYAKHAAESGLDKPKEPILFAKATSALSGPNDTVVIPKNSEATDWEVELGVVIGRDVEHVSEAEALDCVAGYCLINDVSERDFQIRRSGQWMKGKSAPTFGPTGPYLVTADEIPNPQDLRCWLKLNGETRQDSSTSDMIFSVAEIVSYLSQFMRLQAGDVIATGTPEGVGMGCTPPRYLKEGDEMELGIEGLGTQKQAVKAYPG